MAQESFIFEPDKVEARQPAAHSLYPLLSRSEPMGADFLWNSHRYTNILSKTTCYPCFPLRNITFAQSS